MIRSQRSYSYEEYIRAMEMIKKLGVSETSRKLSIHWRTLYHWKNGEHIPPVAKWHPEPSNEIAYIIGVLHGDGSLYIDMKKYAYQYKIQLAAKDYEFTEIFSRTIAKLLNRKYLVPRWNKSNNVWVVVYCSEAFYTWYKKQSLESLKPYIEYSRETIANFLRGLYDSDGGHYIYKRRYSKIHLGNNSLKLLKYVQYLLEKYFGINATGPYINARAGTECKMKNGKTVKRNYNNYSIYISRKQHIQRFLSMIGFSITEKQLGLPRRK